MFIRKLRLMAIASVLAISAIAVARANQDAARDEQTWYYDGPTSPSSIDLNTPSNYVSTLPDGVTCGGEGILCSIQDEPDASGQHPQLSHGTVSTTNVDYSPTRRE